MIQLLRTFLSKETEKTHIDIASYKTGSSLGFELGFLTNGLVHDKRRSRELVCCSWPEVESCAGLGFLIFQSSLNISSNTLSDLEAYKRATG